MESRRRILKEDSEKMVYTAWKDKLKFLHLACLILFALIAAALHLTGNNNNVNLSIENIVLLKEEQTVSKNGTFPGCNLFLGKWIYDNISYPLYKESQCSFLINEFVCEKYGRKDLKYQNWRWQPHHCDVPRFNGTALLEKIKGKKLVFVGDSLIRNQWRSMLCLIESYLPLSSDKSLKLRGNFYYFHSMEYNATIGFYWEPLLVESNSDNITDHARNSRIIRINSIETHGRHWIDADILVFNSFAWWRAHTMTILWGSFGSSDAINKTVEMRLRRYEMALNTWSDWLEFNINQTKTKLFFMSLSPYHYYGESWDEREDCSNKTGPILKKDYWGIDTERGMMRVAESVIQKLETRGLKVEYLNITHLSDYRLDAHPSIYKKFRTKVKHLDCVHWCLPGVPDVWNQILHSYIINSG